jgi:hypothetical protein
VAPNYNVILPVVGTYDITLLYQSGAPPEAATFAMELYSSSVLVKSQTVTCKGAGSPSVPANGQHPLGLPLSIVTQLPTDYVKIKAITATANGLQLAVGQVM